METVELDGGRAVLHRGDRRELLPILPGEAVVTDPVWPGCKPGFLPGADDPVGLFAAACRALPASVRRLVVILRNDGDPRFLAAVPPAWPFFRATVLPYALPGYTGRKLGGDELAHGFGTPIASAPGRRVIPGRAPTVMAADRQALGHPCARALRHMRFLIEWWSDPDETVCDPFMGSATVGVAALHAGRRFVGCEIDPGYFDLACRRIDEAARQPDLFAPRFPPCRPVAARLAFA